MGAPGRPPKRAVGVTREQVRKLHEAGRSGVEIAQYLGISKSTVSFHIRRLALPIDARFARRYDWTEVQRAHDAGLRALECCERFGFSKATWSSAVKRGDVVPRSPLLPLEELLVVGRRTNRGHLKKRLIDAGLKEPRCERCGIDRWLDRPLSMALHHINGVGDDNRLENLQILCPNCHAQTPNYGGRNGHRRVSTADPN